MSNFDYKAGLESDDYFLIAKAHVYELVIEKGQLYQQIRIHKDEYPMLKVIDDGYIFKWVQEARKELKI
ncbi:MAG: hypothetical protein LBR15_11110 [Methanobrevibacter sp.]|jgi:hypothetical protein|nr:hypothetical protein [Candidatus Methanovirga australis]